METTHHHAVAKLAIITGGGTGGHVFPAVAILQELKRRGWNTLYVGSERGLEAKIAARDGIHFVSVKSAPMKNQTMSRRILGIFRLVAAFFWACKLILTKRPRAVVGVGGYVSFPIGIAASVLRVPMFLQEQNCSVGIANRVLGRLARRVFLGFERGQTYFPKGVAEVTGNPLRPPLDQPQDQTYQATGSILLVLGGSQGAKAINEAVLELLPKLPSGVTVWHQTGEKDFPRVQEAYAKLGRKEDRVSPFIEDMGAAYGKATLVISRSGALTVSELIAAGRPVVFVPYPRQGQNDQTANAYFLQERGVARVVEQGPDFSRRLQTSVLDIWNPTTLTQMQRGFSQLRTSGALATICDRIEKLSGI